MCGVRGFFSTVLQSLIGKFFVRSHIPVPHFAFAQSTLLYLQVKLKSCPFPVATPTFPAASSYLSPEFSLFVNEICVWNVCKSGNSWLKTKRIVARFYRWHNRFWLPSKCDAQFFQFFFVFWFWPNIWQCPYIHAPHHRFRLHVNPCHCVVFIA